MQDRHELAAKLRRIAAMKRKTTLEEVELEPPVSTTEGFQQFILEYPDIRRWYLARIYNPDRGESYIDLYFASPSDSGRQYLGGLDEAHIRLVNEDDPSWWEGEEFDLTFHLRHSELRRILRETSKYPDDQPLVEGMVFLQIVGPAQEPQFVPFSFQAREASKQVYKKLMK
jgi:hypothetical protein